MLIVSWTISLTVNIIIMTFVTSLVSPSVYGAAEYTLKPHRSSTTAALEKNYHFNHFSNSKLIHSVFSDRVVSSEKILKQKDLNKRYEFLSHIFEKFSGSNIENIYKPLHGKSYYINVPSNIYTIANEILLHTVLIYTSNTIMFTTKLNQTQTSIKYVYNETSLTQETEILIKALSTVAASLKSELQSAEGNFYKTLDHLERKFYFVTFKKLTSISPENRRENGISFVQSALFLQLVLIALSSEVDEDSRKEINNSLKFKASFEEMILIINSTLLTLPQTNYDLNFYWSSRLVLWPGQDVSEQFQCEMAAALQLGLDRFNGTETPEQIARALNHMVETDTKGAIHDTFNEGDISDGVKAVLLTTLYLRGRWRSAPTLLNGTKLFKDVADAPQRFVRFIRINDVMRYADLIEWDAEVIEIFYATPGLSLLLLIPRGRSLKRLVEAVAGTSIHEVIQRMYTLRVGATLPLYTLRMTLLLPNKLESMGISRLMGVNVTTNGSLTLSHAVQRIMFWAEAGRNAFKDDGMEWDEVPELELVVDRPYIFFVRWNNLTIMNGNFVL